MIRQYETRPGRRYPSGASVEELGVNFSVYGRHATGAELLLYASATSAEPFQVIRLDPRVNHTFFTWHVLVIDLPPGVHYTWRMDGPYDPSGRGLRFDARVELIDPWARAATTEVWDRWRRWRDGPQPHDSPRAVVLAETYDWEGDRPLRIPSEETIIYELHVGGFTRDPSSGVRHPGTFAGIIEKIPYLEALGITHVELMPVMAFDVQDVPKPVWEAGLSNYWGYSTHSFFSPHPGYCVTPEAGTHRREFRDMVKALHRAGIGVILDVVFNHTAEGNGAGPVINFKGFGNETFYCLDQINKGIYLDFTGCGNTVNANHPFVSRFIIDCLEYWVREMHVDGFRFDLASAMARDANGMPMAHPPVIWGIELSEALASTKIIAEAWDAAGLYQVGSFPGYRWMEWNGRYRDSIRRFVRGDPGLVGEVATRIAGSSDLYEANLRLPINSINFITCHDGFTLADLVSYEHKHNEANHEGNRDGSKENLSWNGGVEGPTDDPLIRALRRRQVRNFLTILMVSQGIPMLLAGDEVMRSQGGNNNAWCQDNATGWFDWGLLETHRDLLRFTRELIALRKRHASLRRRYFLSGRHRAPFTDQPDIRWHGLELDAPNWDDERARYLAFTLSGRTAEEAPLHVLLNMDDEPQTFALPVLPDWTWRRAVDTGLDTPEDISPPLEQPAVTGGSYRAGPHTIVVLEAIPAA
ncbi:glycogen debranching protein GlgX [Thiococcus pfennigii]|jgi:glycogen operon protein|uniref:glycogen debranching protein GlgX n=1 Tax=Thiococcus pfennigii TaxID=1057 RepID=UPI001903C142|nr:glycogen debranching protein GlgX [Thiococcus pfennigii]MBK1702792.1 glycogen debranching enzyme GlgX [Thiococcus pfennigii]MBK1732060.1 glycogen debranching enzyme GlgX [Thiococcus pfennigii]